MEENRKPKILLFCDYYLPGYKSGGGMRTIVNMVDRLHHRYDFWIVTRDHDGKLDKEQYKTVKINQWNALRHAQVYYLSKDTVRISKLRELILEVRPDALYANSFFATLSIILVKLRKLKLIPHKNIIIAPCGELSDGSLQLKSAKKRIFINLSKISGLYRDIIWKASSDLEREEISKIKGKDGKIFISADLPPKMLCENYVQEKKPEKKVGTARMIFLSRFMRKKNFKWLLPHLENIKGHLSIDIYGPLEDLEYWEECQKIIKTLPENIKIQSKGAIEYEQTAKTLFAYHFFILPTLAENFGHVFLEALAAGCPLVISDRTPWLDLEKKEIGWDLPLENANDWIDKINRCISMNNEEYSRTSSSARAFALDWLADEKVEKDTIEVLDYSLLKTLSRAI